MRVLIRNLVIILVVMGVAVWSIVPPEKKLRLGKDLRGGVSLIYSVQVQPGDKDVVPKVIEVLKQRVDPNGLAEISIMQQGRDRIEITMPLPSARVKHLKQVYEDELTKLGATNLDAAQFERLMRAQGAERDQEIARVSGGDAARADALKKAGIAADAAKAARTEMEQARTELKAAQDANKDKPTIDALAAKVDQLEGKTADAEIAYDAARKTAMSASLPETDVRRALELSPEPRSITDSQTGQQASLPSPRDAALKRLREQYPAQQAALDRILKAYDEYAQQRTRLDDPSDLKRMVSGAGVLDFRITVNSERPPPELPRLRRELHERGPRNVQATTARWYKVNKIETWFDSTRDLEELTKDPSGYFQRRYRLIAEEYDGEYYVLCWDVEGSRLTRAEGNDWGVAAAFPSSDGKTGLPAISFEMNPIGASKLNKLTKAHVGDQMAVLLDDQVYTAPTLQSNIGRSGQITGQFGEAEIRYIVRVLSAGSLQAKLSPEPISEATLAPELGADNLKAGLKAGVISLIVISGFMIVYYFGSGVISVVALFANAILILGLMAMNHAAFTMPGIAGVILTFGMAVDANVLIYERMREEIQRGADLRTAVRLGYSKALASIVDGNVTNLIHCVVLYFVGTQEIKGFAITMGIGVLTTLFTALFISRWIYALLVDFGPWKRASMLPLVIPAIDRFFHRNINWLKLRYIFWGLSTCYVLLGLGMVVFRGKEMLDTQFRGGTQIIFNLKDGPDGKPLTMTRKDVENKLAELGKEEPGNKQVQLLAASAVLPINPDSTGVTSSTFKIKSLATDPSVVRNALAQKFQDKLETRPKLKFSSEEVTELRSAPVYPIITGKLGEDIQRPNYRDEVRPFMGGVAVVMENIGGGDTAPTLSSLKARLERERTDPEFSDTLVRDRSYIVLEGNEDNVKSLAMLVRDPTVSYFDDQQRWTSDVAGREWKLASTALGTSSTSASVEVFSPTIARTFTAQAIVAMFLGFLLVGIYIWVRFGALSYALAGIIPLFHDVLTAVGFIALAQVLYESSATQAIAHSLGLMPFKIDLNMVAALLTIVGYSLNDTIIVMDRIRENRGKLSYATEHAINSAVNMTVSRTVITSGTVLMASIVLYIFGGEAMRGFSYALIIGVAVGTYSSIAIAAPIVWVRKPPAPPTPPSKGGKAATLPAPQPAGA